LDAVGAEDDLWVVGIVTAAALTGWPREDGQSFGVKALTSKQGTDRD